MNGDPRTCQELVELVTEYLEQTLSPEDRERFYAHLAQCDPCVTYVTQMKQTLDVVGRISEESVPPEARQRLLKVFRGWSRAQQ